MTDKPRKVQKPQRQARQCISRLSSVVAQILDEGTDPPVVMEALTVIRRNLSLPVPRPQRLTVALVSASLLSPKELRQLHKWLVARIAEDREEEAAIPPSPSRIVVEERQYRGVTYRRELVKCGSDSCQKCRSAPTHGPYWYVYGDVAGGTHRYIGKTLPPKLTSARSGAWRGDDPSK
jgi:hypothetical protein